MLRVEEIGGKVKRNFWSAETNTVSLTVHLFGVGIFALPVTVRVEIMEFGQQHALTCHISSKGGSVLRPRTDDGQFVGVPGRLSKETSEGDFVLS